MNKSVSEGELSFASHRLATLSNDSTVVRSSVVCEFSMLRLLRVELALCLATISVISSRFMTLENEATSESKNEEEGSRESKLTAGIHFFEFQGLQLGSLYIMSTFSRERFDNSYKKKKTGRRNEKISLRGLLGECEQLVTHQ